MMISEENITTERRFSDLWERSLVLRPDVVDGDGNRYEVIFPGIRNQGAGPDFTGAVLRRGGRTFGGDVELHLDQSGWRGHGHHKDPAYNGVVLQAVLRLARNSDHHPVPPTASVVFPTELQATPSLPSLSLPDLEDLGAERFLAKSAGFRLELDAGSGRDQALYMGLMEAMGYVRNRKPFLSLSKAVPISVFRSLSNEPSKTAEFGIFATLAAAGNVLERIAQPERGQIRRVASKMGVRRRLSAKDWSMFRVRPRNSPVNRMRAISHIVVHSLDVGLYGRLRDEFKHGGVEALAKSVARAPHIGLGFTLTVVSNVLLPCLYAIQPSDSVVEAFREMPPPPADSVTRGIANALGVHAVPANAAQHSGLHALAKSSSWPGD